MTTTAATILSNSSLHMAHVVTSLCVCVCVCVWSCAFLVGPHNMFLVFISCSCRSECSCCYVREGRKPEATRVHTFLVGLHVTFDYYEAWAGLSIWMDIALIKNAP